MSPPDTTADPRDPLGPLGHRSNIPVLGIPVSFETNDAQVLRLVEDAFGAWHVLEQLPQLIADAQMSFRIWVEDGEEASARHAPVTRHEPDDDRVVLITPGAVAIADSARGDAIAWIQRSLLAERAHVRHRIIEAAAIAILTRFDRQPVPAAAIEREGTALVLGGAAGSGKSTLACLASRQGYHVLADDAVYIQMRPQLRVWGMPGHIQLPLDAHRHFPDLTGDSYDFLGGAVHRMVLSTRELKALPEMPLAPAAGVCVLVRGGDGPALETLPGDALEEELARAVRGSGTLDPATGNAIHALTRFGGWRLDPGQDPKAALPLIAQMFDYMNGE
ncbi:MAG: hypothetical protein L0271_19840 [Gemmatimonadetes bacterium]|nr:hypothetical protein [Gemmatimonadota bacterium]